MRLTPKEIDKLLLHSAGELAKQRRARGILLNYPEAVAFISSELMELARDGHTVTELMQMGTHMLSSDEVMDGVPQMIHEVQVEATFPDGTKLVTVHNPIRPNIPNAQTPGAVMADGHDIELNADRTITQIVVANTGDRPIQVGSHFHFYEVNKALSFDRDLAFGKRLDIPSGTSVRFEPGETKNVQLVTLGGLQEVYGLNNLTNGYTGGPVITGEEQS